MAINRNYSVPRIVVKDGSGQELGTVRGLSFNDVTQFLDRNFDNFDRLMTMWDHYHDLSKQQNADQIMSDGVLIQFCADLAMQAPGLLVDIISLAADVHDGTPDEIENDMAEISKWSLHSQTVAAVHIYNLTVVDYGGPKKLIGAVLNQFRNLKSGGLLA